MNESTELLLSIAEGTSRLIGREFLDSIVASLRDAMDVSVVVLTEKVDGEDGASGRARSLVARKSGKTLENFEYDLAGTPCEQVYDGTALVVADDLALKFKISSPAFASYVGVPLHNRQGEVTGHISVISEKPLADPAFAETVLRIYGQRAEAEIQRLDAERERDALLDDLQRLNRRLADNYETVRKANEYKTEVLGMVAHDLRNPLGQIMGFADLIEMELVDNERVEAAPIAKKLDYINRAARDMMQQVERVLESAREEADELPLKRQCMDIVETINSSIRVSERRAVDKNISLSYSGPGSLMAEVDPDLTMDVLDNLIGNAVKYSGPDSRVTISASADEKAVKIAVQDQGQGLDAEDLAKAFGRFQRLSATPTGGETSVGLGLNNVRTIMERHGGAAGVESPGKGRGATFTIMFPRHAANGMVAAHG